MFHSAALKLTLWYLGLIMALSIGMSGIIYRMSSDELAQDAQRQITYFNNQLPPSYFNNFSRFRSAQLDESNARLKSNLIVFNILVLLGGGFVSYLLARRTLEPIEEALESQKRFTGDASHELRTPLTIIQTENEVALRNPGLTKKQAVALLESNLEEVAKLKALSDGLLKLHNGAGQTYKPEVLDLKKVADSALERWQKAADKRRIKIDSDLSSAKVLGEPEGLTELISILLDNAIKYSPDKSKIELSVGKKDKQAYVRVADQGEGIRSSDLPHIFDRFFRADHSRSKLNREGYGLGLAIAKKIADMHGASIDVKSALGQGSTFTIRFPAV